MKTLSVSVLALLCFTFSGCKDELFDLKFGLNTKEMLFTLDPTVKAGDIILSPQTQNINLDSLAMAFGADISKIQSVTVKKITASIVNPTTSNFDILESGILNISTGNIGDPDFDLLKIAEFNQVPKGIKELNINPSSEDVLKFAKKPKLTVSGKLVTNAPLITATTIKLVVDFEVVANPIK